MSMRIWFSLPLSLRNEMKHEKQVGGGGGGGGGG